ncbi:S-adenosyl-L-methionine-dependent tRNA 4-demethylwyosine synthase [Perkinsus olseni]|uniref:tRNA 4-demethylwyosine synthase (AdoMet-dependent) n=1 Tax=Perkinsus olseni TaxID=32597 RepID=A0A7J6L3Z8_PEROL|nr:S-adenosyl-L-methionine-dependent tRNA 4-demethylwyosine synthase [Perkinsus olseni]
MLAGGFYRALLSKHYSGPSRTVKVVYSSRTGTSKAAAGRLKDTLESDKIRVILLPIEQYSYEELCEESYLVLLLSTDTDGTPLPGAKDFTEQLRDAVYDFRVDKNVLEKCKVAVIGFGSEEYPAKHYCKVAKNCDDWLAKLGAQRVSPLLCISDTRDVEKQVSRCIDLIKKAYARLDAEPTDQRTADLEDDVESVGSEESTSDTEDGDVEDASGACGGNDKEMVTKKHRAALTREGYRLVGSHSAVKLCRWTKHQVRGRGGCYKHSFYGIESHQCMEATASLACANKCVFCWRHHRNPVGRSWTWAQDPPEEIVNGWLGNHAGMVKELKGVPGVTPERFEQAKRVRHCALSLVGEPIIYPQINTALDLLHQNGISTFMVTNGQFPEAIRSLIPVTQLYVSVDASNAEDMKAIDRPLFEDFWDRFIDSLTALKHKKQRTVYRMTLVKGYNISTAAEYAELLHLGNPHFLEIKAVTFCGKGDGSAQMTMENVPWFEEVVEFAQMIIESSPWVEERYEIACTHRHSCTVLIAQKSFKVDGVWHTWIDYDKFTQLALKYSKTGKPFAVEEYWAPTPAWAVYGAEEEGFDPEMKRHYRNGKTPELGKQIRAKQLREEQERSSKCGDGKECCGGGC